MRYRYKYLLLIATISLSVMSLRCLAVESDEPVSIRVYPDESINEDFYGFGVETLPWLYTEENKEAGVDKEDIRLNIERIKDMRLPVTRIFVPWETWNPTADYKTFTWESDEMKSLYRILDIYQKMETQVIVVTVDWLKDCPWKDAEGSSFAVLNLLDHLIDKKGYTCVRFWTLTNEPELTYGWLKKTSFKNYVEVHKSVKKGLEERGLQVKIIASDEVESMQWFEDSIQSLHDTADIFSSHTYLYPEEINTALDFFDERLAMIDAISGIKEDMSFFICEFGFRGSDFSATTNDLIDDYKYGVYTADFCIEALNAGVDLVSLWCLHEIRLIDEIDPEGGMMMRIGLWGFRDKGWRLFPVYHIYRLLTRHIKSGSRVLKVEIDSTDNMLKAACVEHKDNYSLIITNMSDESKSFLVEGISLNQDFKKYLYTASKFEVNKNDLLIRDLRENDSHLNDEIPAKSVVFYTSL